MAVKEFAVPAKLPAGYKLLQSAKCPEDVFGPNGDKFSSTFREWARLTHEDLAPKTQKAIAHEAFILLQKWKQKAEDKVKSGDYGDYKPTISLVIKTKTTAYVLTGLISSGDMCDIYDAFSSVHTKLLIKVVRNPANNDLLQNEATNLIHLRNASNEQEFRVVPHCIDSVEFTVDKVKRRANIFVPAPETVTLTQIHEAYPVLDVRDAAWMFNRILDGLCVAHRYGFVHGAVTPDHMLVSPETHLGLLIDYSYSVKGGQIIKAISNPKWRAFYPPEVFSKNPAERGTDIYMAASVMIYLLGGDVLTGKIPNAVPVAVRGLLRACRLMHVSRRNPDVSELYKEFNGILKALYGPKKFREFKMPVT